ncbi:MAG: hopanoid biosynthesis-associated protein HpnK [Candidatus Eremiobacteraeota bacterium]|nr:hopanoid biosynthesis-associated protein HpnK [Candidatus Eremiobacteraeota bacterium]
MDRPVQRSRRRLIISADDFGMSADVNDAIERAHTDGVLTTTCLMMSGDAAADAVARAKRLPGLRVGLHVVLVDGRPVLPAREVPDLVDRSGEFTKRLVGAGFKYFFHPRVRRQLEAEIRAQFAAFAATGLRLDHVNAHNHMHVHPTIFGLLLKVGRDHGDPPVRIPYEPLAPSWRARHTGFAGRFGNGVLLAPFFAMMRARARAAGVAYNQYVFGMNDTGNMTSEVVTALLRELPRGASEMYLHPATSGPQARELAALVDPAVALALQERGVERIGFADVRMP